MFRVAKKIRNVKDNIKKWNKETFGNIFWNKRKILEELKDIHDNIQKDGYENFSREEEDFKLVYPLSLRRKPIGGKDLGELSLRKGTGTLNTSI